jgi:hypothetical protein
MAILHLILFQTPAVWLSDVVRDTFLAVHIMTVRKELQSALLGRLKSQMLRELLKYVRLGTHLPQKGFILLGACFGEGRGASRLFQVYSCF